ncbi:MAG: glycosyltransferase family 4 protein [Anaerolineales bacterium]|nr:glycosyltransferase family 4 protein [Anaerolineales bacterium]
MHILTALTYYRPHHSGLTIYTERLARALAARGHQVTVLTSQYEDELPRHEHLHGVDVIRLPVRARLSKGVIMPGIPFWAWKLARQADVVHLHLPQFDAAPISLIARLLGKPVVVTYHCDLLLPHGFIHKIANLGSNIANHITATLANMIVTNTQDYADNSDYLSRYARKVRAIPPPVIMPEVSAAEVQAFREKFGIQPGECVIGMLGRLAAEKGVEYLVEAMPKVLEQYPDARAIHVGQYQNVMGEEQYAQKLAPLIADLGAHWKFLGVLLSGEVSAFLHACDVLVAPSTNSTESFGMVQVEAMTCGTPAIASDIPGARQPVLMTKMGEVVPVAAVDELAAAIIKILANPDGYQGDIPAITKRFSPQTIAEEYEQLFAEITA